MRRYRRVSYERRADFPRLISLISPWLIRPGKRHGGVERLLWAFCVYAAILPSAIRLSRLVRQDRCHAVLLYGRLASQGAALIAVCRWHGIPIVLDVTEHEHAKPSVGGALNPMHWDALLATHLIPRLCTGVTVITRGLESLYRRKRCKKVMLLPSVERWDALPPVEVARHGHPTIAYVGALLPRDDPNYLLALAREAWRMEGPTVRIRLIGRFADTPGGVEIQKEIAVNPQLASVFEVIGAVSDDELRGYLRSSDGLLLSRRDSFSEALAFPTRLVEYLQMGRPVFARGVGDVPHYIQHQVNGFMLSGDPRSDCRLIEKVLSQPDRGSAVGAAGWKTGRECFDRDVHARRLLAFWAGELPEPAPLMVPETGPSSCAR